MIAAFALAVALDSSTPDPNATVNIDGIAVTSAHVDELLRAFRGSHQSDAIAIQVKTKPTSEMPWYDPHWHYAGSSVDSSSVVHAEVWVNEIDVHAKDHYAVVGIAAGVLLADMESGFAGPYWKEFYAAEASRDKLAAARGDNPFVHRDTAAELIAEAIVDH
jgi:hypothetical protein